MKKLPYGLALMILRGSTTDLLMALENENLEVVKLKMKKLENSIKELERSIRLQNSIVQRTFELIEDQSLTKTHEALEESARFLRSKIALL